MCWLSSEVCFDSLRRFYNLLTPFLLVVLKVLLSVECGKAQVHVPVLLSTLENDPEPGSFRTVPKGFCCALTADERLCVEFTAEHAIRLMREIHRESCVTRLILGRHFLGLVLVKKNFGFDFLCCRYSEFFGPITVNIRNVGSKLTL